MKQKLIFLSIFSICLSLFSGKLESFEDDFEFIVKNAKIVERLDSRAKYRDDFRLKLFRLQADASDIQLVATQIGIRDITISKNVKEMIDTINVDRKSNIKRERYENRSFATADIRRQIHYLRNLRFSVEKRTFVPNKSYFDDLNVQIRFSRRWEHCKNIAFSKRVLSQYAISEYNRRYFGEILRLARMIDQKIKKDKIKISDRFQLFHNVNRFVNAWKINADHYEQTKKRYNDDNHSGNYRTTPEVEARINEMKLLAQEIENDMNYLAETGFSMYLKDSRFSEKQLLEMKQRLEKQQKEEKALPGHKTDEPPPVLREKPDMKKLTRLYNEKKQVVYQSESKMNGVSQNFYNKYRNLLPERQKKELDSERKRYLDESYPPALARSTAVKKLHLKYGGNNHKCTADELMSIMKVTPGAQKK